MDGLEQNKIFAAALLACLTAMFAGFIAELTYDNKAPEVAAVEIDTSAFASAAPVVDTGPETIELVSPLLASADPSAGESLLRQCTSCHNFTEGGRNQTGPNLWNIVNADKGGKDGFNYSSALAEIAGVWGYEALNAFFYAPGEYVPGTRMIYRGMDDVEDRANLIAYLRTLSDSPAPLPAADAYPENAMLLVGPPDADGSPQVLVETAEAEAEADSAEGG